MTATHARPTPVTKKIWSESLFKRQIISQGCVDGTVWPEVAQDLKSHAESLERERDALAEMLREAKDTVQASIAEDGISEARTHYREKLHERISELLATLAATRPNQ